MVKTKKKKAVKKKKKDEKLSEEVMIERIRKRHPEWFPPFPQPVQSAQLKERTPWRDHNGMLWY